MTPPRQVIQVSAYYPPHLGGQENAVYDLAKQLAKTGQAVQVLASSIGGGPKGTSLEDGMKVTRLPAFVFGHAPIMPAFIINLLKLTRKNSLVHVHVGQAFTPEMVWLASKLRGFAYIAQLHIDFEPSGPAGFLLPFYKRFVLKRVLGSAAAVVTLNQKTLRTVRRNYGYKGRAKVLNNGIDEVYFAAKPRAARTKPPAVLRLLFVGRLSRQKNILALLRALTRTKRTVRLDIIGEGAEQALVQKFIADHQLGGSVVMHGRLPRRDVVRFYETCHALILPSLYEAQPLVLLEAMAARIPIIGTNVIGVKEHINNAGIIVEPTAEGLVEGIEQFYKRHRDIPAMISKAYDTATKMRWPQTIKRYQALYEEVARY